MAIQKPEWFKIDPAKFVSDAQVDAMSTLELGACMRLLFRQWLDGFIPDDLRLLARLCRLDEAAMRDAWVTLSPFFPEMHQGKRANRFMWIEREKVISRLERLSDEGTRAARKRWDQTKRVSHTEPIGSPIGDPMQDQTRADQSRAEENPSSEHKGRSDQGDTATSKNKKQPSQDACRLAALLKSEILRNKADYRITQGQERKWAATAQRMLEIDERSFDKVADLIRWAQRDEFERTNVLSMDKLRTRFDQLSMKAKIKSPAHNSCVTLPADYVSAGEKIRAERGPQEAVAQ